MSRPNLFIVQSTVMEGGLTNQCTESQVHKTNSVLFWIHLKLSARTECKYCSLHKKGLFTVPMCSLSLSLFQLCRLLLCVTPNHAPLMNPAITWPYVPDFPLRGLVCVSLVVYFFVINDHAGWIVLFVEYRAECSVCRAMFSLFMLLYDEIHMLLSSA